MGDSSAQAPETTLIRGPIAPVCPSAGQKESPLRTITTTKQDVLTLPIQLANTLSSTDSRQTPQTEKDLRLWADTLQSLRRLLQGLRNIHRRTVTIRPHPASPSLESTRRESPTERLRRINTILSSRPSSPKQNLSRLAGLVD